jgi:glycine/D-amino acid oxidase-like deaminating enzyme
MDDAHLDAIADAYSHPYWYDDVDQPESNPMLVRTERCDLCVVGGGYTGLWTAIIAKERDPSRDVVLLEAGAVGSAASGRNGGFMESSLTHGVANGQDRFPNELPALERLGLENLNQIEAAIERYGIDCDYERTGVIDIAIDQPMLMELRADAEQLHRLGQDVVLLDQDAMQAEVHSPTYHGGLWRRDRAALLDPARLVWGLKVVAESLGVRVYEDTKVTSVEHDGVGIMATTPLGRVRSEKVALGTNAFPPLLRRMKHYIAPVYDYALTTEPLTPEQRASLAWARRQGLSDMANQFHYYRLTEDERILWGGYDAIYYFGGTVTNELEQRPETWALLAEHFFTTFPQLAGVQFSHAWGGVIDTSTRFCQFWGTAMKGKVAYCLGFTGLGVAATRFGAEVMLDLLDGRRSEAASLEFVRRKPLPFPPEPIRYAGIQATRWSLDRADRNGGRRNLWLRGLDRFGLRFDS